MLDYIQKLTVAKDVENLAPFAIRHSKIAKLEKLKNEAFNSNGISSTIYLTICFKLYELYTEDEDYDAACNIALNIYQGCEESKDDDIKKEAILHLTEAYLNIHDILEAKKYYEKINIGAEDFYYPQYLVCKSQMAKLEKDVEKETNYLRAAYNRSIKADDPINIQINILAALCLSYERNRIFDKAFHGYLELSEQITQNNYPLTNEQQISLQVRIATLATLGKNYTFAIELFSTLSNVSEKILRDNHPLRKVIKEKFETTKSYYKNQRV